ncbi:hypothetical protein [Actibacterium pelagium]|uniref:Uncharacterized protein n=1 Tax=Actibacterium pelagium TaxID=2029103 RepID=A0A917ACN6_9RHOB|nr:hypothetical protein [Actibacterium pelagium]GGE42994.1 hypothetical protein GCM10011517_08270 [Actibacterium pelagium]
MQHFIFLSALIAAFPSVSSSNGLEGTIGIGTVGGNGTTEATLYTDAIYTLDFGGFGAQVGSYGVWTKDDHPHETYAALFADVLDGRVSLGVPRPAYDLFAVSVADSALPFVGINQLGQTRSYATLASAELEEVPLGILYQSSVGRTAYALSAHSVDVLDTQVLSFGVGIDAGDWTLSGGLEYIDHDTGSDANAKLQANHQLDQFGISVSYFLNSYDAKADLAELALTYQPNARVTATGFVQQETSGGSETAIGAAVDVAFGQNLYLKAGISHQDVSDTAFSTFVGWAF